MKKQYHLLLLILVSLATCNLFSMKKEMKEKTKKKEKTEYYIKALKDMSKEDALVALYEFAKKPGTGWDAFGCDRPFLNKQNVTTELSRNNDKVEKVRGRLVYADFTEFPFIAITRYDKIHGSESAKEALDKHRKRFRVTKKKKRAKSLS